MTRRNNTQTGFTIIELMLAMSFVAMLLLAIAMVTIQIGHIYTKGITLREVNQAGRQLSDELQRSIAASGPINILPGSGSHLIDQSGEGGRLCVGNYTYVWNYGKALTSATGGPNVYDTGTTPIRFVKVADTGASLCADPSKKIVQANATELLDSGDRELVLHTFQMTPQVSDAISGQAMYAINLTLGTNDQEELMTGDQSCKPPVDSKGGQDYCAVNQFNIIARAGSKAGGN